MRKTLTMVWMLLSVAVGCDDGPHGPPRGSRFDAGEPSDYGPQPDRPRICPATTPDGMDMCGDFERCASRCSTWFCAPC